MPLVDWNLESQWRSSYNTPITDETGLVLRFATYGRDFWTNGGREPTMPFFDNRVTALVALGITQSQRILIGGSAFGFLIERFRARGYTNCWGIDSSTWIDSRGPLEMTDTSVFVRGSFTGGGAIRNALNSLTGARTFDWIISEDLLTSCTDAELPTYLNAAEQVLTTGRPLTNIVHMVWPGNAQGSSPFNQKTLAQWKAVRSTHTWMSAAEPYEVAA